MITEDEHDREEVQRAFWAWRDREFAWLSRLISELEDYMDEVNHTTQASWQRLQVPERPSNVSVK